MALRVFGETSQWEKGRYYANSEHVILNLSNGECQRTTGPATATAQIARVATRRVDGHVRVSRGGNQVSRDRYLQLLAAQDGRA